MEAVALMVIEVETRSSGMASNSAAMSSTLEIATPDLADLAAGHRVVGVVAHLGGQVEGHAEPALPLLEQVAEAAVGLGRRSRSPRTGAWSRAARGTWWAARRG